MKALCKQPFPTVVGGVVGFLCSGCVVGRKVRSKVGSGLQNWNTGEVPQFGLWYFCTGNSVH